MKKILVITNSGVGLYCFRKELILKLLEDYEVYLLYPKGDYADWFERLGCKYRQIELDSSSTNPIKDIGYFRECTKAISSIKPDVALLYTIKPCIYAGVICSIKHIPVVSTVTGISPALISEKPVVRSIATILCRFGYRYHHVVFFQNEENYKMYKKRRIYGKKNLIIYGSGVNLKEHQKYEYPANDGKIRVLYMGRMIKIKGLEEFAEAIINIKRKKTNIECRIVGEWVDDLHMLKSAVDNGIIEYCEETDKPDECYKWCDVLVMPSYGEGMSNVIQEAAACGRPALASDIPGCRELIDEGKTGLLFEPRSTKDLENKLIQFIEISYKSRAEMGENARRKMEADFSREHIVNKYIKAISKVCR